LKVSEPAVTVAVTENAPVELVVAEAMVSPDESVKVIVAPLMGPPESASVPERTTAPVAAMGTLFYVTLKMVGVGFWDALVGFFYRLFGYRRVTATSVLESGGKPVEGAPITLHYIHSPSTVTDGTALTDGTGTATESVYLRPGEYTFVVVFPGSPSYRMSTASVAMTVA
jgi:hypothetical protein